MGAPETFPLNTRCSIGNGLVLYFKPLQKTSRIESIQLILRQRTFSAPSGVSETHGENVLDLPLCVYWVTVKRFDCDAVLNDICI